MATKFYSPPSGNRGWSSFWSTKFYTGFCGVESSAVPPRGGWQPNSTHPPRRSRGGRRSGRSNSTHPGGMGLSGSPGWSNKFYTCGSWAVWSARSYSTLPPLGTPGGSPGGRPNSTGPPRAAGKVDQILQALLGHCGISTTCGGGSVYTTTILELFSTR